MTRSRIDLLAGTDLPQRFGRYELQAILGEGGMARVFQAELIGPAGFRKQVAVKVIKARAAGWTSAEQVESFVREARLGGLLKHPNIVDVYELGEAEGQFFITMELVAGLTLSQLIASGRQLPAPTILEIAAGVAAGLASAHSLSSGGHAAGLVHRDLKPSNVLLSRDGAVKIADFGIAVTRAGELAGGTEAEGELVGTLSYMSPEQLLGQALDGRSDLFSFGLVLCELAIATRLPRRLLYKRMQAGGDLSGPMLSARVLKPVETAVPGLSRIIARCLQFMPEARYPTAEALCSELEELRGTLGVQPRLRTWLPGEFDFTGPDSVQMSLPGSDRTDGTATEGEASTVIIPGPRARTNMGPPLDSFVGREAELAELGRLLQEGARLVTVKGTGGVGKTRFARRLARSLWDAFPGGTWFVDLTEARTPMGLVHATATALDVPLGGEDFDALVTQLSHAIAGRGQVLLVVDNFEQVVEHAPVTLGRWLELAPDARFLATSREPLKLVGEQVFPLGPLSEEDGIALFEQRATAAGARWQPSAATRAAVARIVSELDGLPLAIELAAARARLLSAAQLLARLAQPFELLRGGRRGDTRRQATLRGMIQWSWQLLEPWEQAALAQLTVFRGGFFMEAAEAVLDLSAWPEAPWTLDVVGSLLDKSLLRSWEVVGLPRFGMYVSVRDYAVEELGQRPALEASALVRRHAGYYARYGTGAYRDSLHTHGGTRRRQLLAQELENLVEGVGSGIGVGENQLAAACALGCWELFRLAGPFLEGAELFERVLVLDGLEPELRMRLLEDRGWLLHLGGRPDEALELMEGSLSLARELGDRRAEGTSLGNLGSLRREQGRIDNASVYYEQALAIARELGEHRSEGIWLGSLGNVHKEQGRIAEGLEYYEQALAISRELGDRRYQGNWLGTMGLLYMEQGRIPEALTYTEEALALAREVGHRRYEGIWLGNLGLLHREQGRIPETLQAMEAALVLARELGDRRSEGIQVGNLGDLLLEQGDFEAAGQRLEQAIVLGEETWPVVAGVFRGSLALVRAQAGDLAAARALLDRGEQQIRGAHAHELGKMLCKRARIEWAAGEPEAAQSARAEARAIAAELQVAPDSDLGQAIAALGFGEN
jgi:predicted ATPase/serine/threonine protein kinase/Tfp pilus assembly protein PilF